MAEKSAIGWTNSTFNPWIGCTKISPGCDGCYAEALMDQRYGRAKWGPGQPRKRTSLAYWRQPLKWDREAKASGERHLVFCASLADVFDNEVENDWRKDLFELIESTPNLTWQLVTKRIGNVPAMVPASWMHGAWPRHVWIGATIVDQQEAERDAPKLLKVPAAVRFVSYEPALGPVDWAPWLPEVGRAVTCNTCGRVKKPRGRCAAPGMTLCDHECDGYDTGAEPGSLWPGERLRDFGYPHALADAPKIDWLIVGGESSQPNHPARPFPLVWIGSTIRQCKFAGVPVFVKQLGSNPLITLADGFDPEALKEGKKWDDPARWPAWLRVQEFPG